MRGHLLISKKMHFVYKLTSYVQPPILKGHFNCVARLACARSAEGMSKRCTCNRFRRLCVLDADADAQSDAQSDADELSHVLN